MTRKPSAYNVRFIWTVCLVAAMGGLLFGYDWVVIGGAKPFYEPYFGISESSFHQGLAMSSALIGCLFGAVVAGMLSDRYGRKRLLILSGLLFTLSAVGTALAWSFTWFNIFRWIGGVGIGLASNLSPMYIAEVSPAKQRGKFVSINQLTIVIGILAAQIANWLIAAQVPTADQLRELASTDEQIRAVHNEPYDPAAARQQAREVTELDAWAKVQQEFPDLGVFPVTAAGKAEQDQQKDAKAGEDQRLMDVYLLATWNGQYGWRWMFGARSSSRPLSSCSCSSYRKARDG